MLVLSCLSLTALLLPCLGMDALEVGADSGCGNNSLSMSYVNKAIEMMNAAKKTYQCCPKPKPVDCEGWLRDGKKASGVYPVWPRSRVLDGKQVDVYCDMDTDGGAWTVLQRRGNYGKAKDYFYRNWASYKAGFGDIKEDFWLGNDNIFALTNQRLYSVRFDLEAVDGSKAYAVYDTFWIDAETNHYKLYIEGYKGNAGDSMNEQNHMKFSTKDVDNAEEKSYNCAEAYKGAWWYKACHLSNLNGLYLEGKTDSFGDGINWYTWKGHYESLKATEIKIRPKNFKK